MAAAAAIGWFTLVTLRSRGFTTAGNGLTGRLDAGVARTLIADHTLSLTAWAGYVSTTLLVGGLVFRRFVARPAAAADDRDGAGASVRERHRGPRTRAQAVDAAHGPGATPGRRRAGGFDRDTGPAASVEAVGPSWTGQHRARDTMDAEAIMAAALSGRRGRKRAQPDLSHRERRGRDTPGRGPGPRREVDHHPDHGDGNGLMRAAIVLGLAAVTLSIPLRAAVLSGRGPAGAVDLHVLVLVVTSPFGNAAALRAGGLALLGASRSGSLLRGVAALGGTSSVVASYLLVGHPQANHPVVLETAAQAVHITAVSVWFGGVVFLAIELRRRRDGAAQVSGRVVSRFSRLAELMVVLVLCSGAILTAGQVALRTAFWSTGYGRALVAKLAFVGVVLAIGGYNRQRVVPAIAEHDDRAAWLHLRRTCIAEALVIGIGVLLMTAAMTSGGFS